MPNLNVQLPKELETRELEAIKKLAQGRQWCVNCKHFVPGTPKWCDAEQDWTKYRRVTSFESVLLRVLGSAVDWCGACKLSSEFVRYGQGLVMEVWWETRWDGHCWSFCPVDGSVECEDESAEQEESGGQD